jgi:hypothetical protein
MSGDSSLGSDPIQVLWFEENTGHTWRHRVDLDLGHDNGIGVLLHLASLGRSRTPPRVPWFDGLKK